MRRRLIYFAGFFLGFILLTNCFSDYFKGLPVYHYENTMGTYKYSVIPWKGLRLEKMESSFDNYLKENNKTRQADRLYRTFPKNYLKFWMWWDYYTDSHYQYPYKKASDLN